MAGHIVDHRDANFVPSPAIRINLVLYSVTRKFENVILVLGSVHETLENLMYYQFLRMNDLHQY